jgi:hypothetical protein
MHFSCRTSGVNVAFTDKSFSALTGDILPPTLGVRPQSLKLRFFQHLDDSCYLKPTVPFQAASVGTEKRLSFKLCTTNQVRVIYADSSGYELELPETLTELKEDRLYCEYFIAETLSIVYTPVYIKNERLYDAILQQPLSGIIDQGFITTAPLETDWPLLFLPTICPDCGWDLIAERDSRILICNHCNKAWETSHSTLRSIPFAVNIIPDQQQKNTLLPFWKIKTSIPILNLKSYGDLIKLANLPKCIKEEWYEYDLYFWIPAFKLAPSVFLRTARIMTITNPIKEQMTTFDDNNIYPISISLSEALDSIKGVLSDIAVRKRDIMPKLAEITVTSLDAILVFHPFLNDRYELIEQEIQYGITKNTLRWGKNL